MEDALILVTCTQPRLQAMLQLLCYATANYVKIMYLTQHAPINHIGWNAVPWSNFARVPGIAVNAARGGSKQRGNRKQSSKS
jgi:hypothetical protein